MLGSKILVPVDGSDLADRILTHVRKLALSEDALVLLLRVLPEGCPELWAGEALRHLEELAREVERTGAATRTHLATGDPAAKILELATTAGVTLVALSTHGRSGLERFVRGSVAERVLRESKAPVLLANPFALPSLVRGAPEEVGFGRILVPLDGSERSARILPLVHEIARVHESRVLLFHVIEPTVALAVGEPLATIGLESPVEAERRLAKWRERLGGVLVDLRVTSGSAASAILEAIDEERPGLVAMATHGRSGPSRWAYGSVAEKVLRASGSPLLLLRSSAEGGVGEGSIPQD